MHELVFFSGSAVLTAVLIIALRGIADRIGLVDRPDERKTHGAVIPIHGGVCMAIVMLAAGVALLVHAGLSNAEWVLLLGIPVFVVIGVLDDRHDLAASLRLIIEVVVLFLLMWIFDFSIESLGNLWGYGPVNLSWLAWPFTLFTIFCLINGMNMLDGMDGLAGGISAVAILWFLAAATLAGETVTPMLWVMLGALGGFLFFNARAPWRERATVFMGDAGSLLLGFVLSWCCIAFTQVDIDGGNHVLRPMTAVWIMALPVIDTVYVVIHRARGGVGIFTPGRDHIHHRLQQLGFSDNAVVRLLWLASAVLGGVGVASDRLDWPEPLMCYGFIALAVLYYLVASRMQRESGEG